MVLTKDERKCVSEVFGHINSDQVGGDALARLLCVDPWCRRYFNKFGDLSSHDAILHNAALAAHGAKVMKSVREAFQHVDDLRGHYADLSSLHSKKFHVDPANFKLFAGMVSTVIGLALGQEYTAHKQGAFEKFLREVSSALSHGYH